MDIYDANFSLEAAFQENAEEASKTLSAALNAQLQQVDAALSKGLAPQEYAEAQHLRTALLAAQGIVTLKYNALAK